MFGFRFLAVILALIFLASAGAMVFYQHPRLTPATEFFLRHFVPDDGVTAFIRSTGPVEMRIKDLARYTLSGLAVCALGLALLFLCAAVNPIRMRPFVSVVMICSAVGVAAAIYQGIRLEVFKSWWIGDAGAGLLLLILLGALYPGKKKTSGRRPLPEGEEAAAE